ncbi:hypothetical protein [Chroococcus sp. FPU101]|uniref:hypothetical protein n=1 Tax=Chroococcus sp. FPU101 TaxID=1974212 RepID=UPI001AA1E46E|nr:hypothetical protein [Chroococcus sp. FPU101]GFE72268.1 hypothetical protein CFPU101_48780 [Chroococcus sp. FPU101]
MEALIDQLNILKLEYREFCVNYLTLKMISDIFTSAGFTSVDKDLSSNPTRRQLVETYYKSVNWQSQEIAQKFMKVIEYTLQLYYLTDESKNELRSLCLKNNLLLKDGKIIQQDLIVDKDLFSYQFPAGLPFGIPKPNFAITAEKGSQKLKYDLQDGLGLLTGKIYPNFSFKSLES